MAIPHVKVRIWLPNGFAYAVGNGHAGLNVMTPEGEKYYVTWLMSRSGCSGSTGSGGQSTSQRMEANKCLGFAKIQNRHTGAIEDNPDRLGTGREFSYSDDKFSNAFRFGLNGQNDRISSNYKVSIPVMKIPCVAPDDNLFGVNVHAIAKWWKRLLALPPGHPQRRYAALSTDRNCCGVVVRALLAGGLGLYASPPSNMIYQGARSLHNWVREAVAKIDDMNAKARQVSLQMQGMPPLAPDQRRMPTLDAWKRLSYVGPFARRKDQVAALDQLIPKYLAAEQTNNLEGQFHTLVEMHRQIFSHLTQKPTSDRRPAVLYLGRVVTGLIQDHAAEFALLYQLLAVG